MGQSDCVSLDEYVGLSGGEEHPASFRKYLKERLFDKLQPTVRKVHYLNPENYEGYEQLLKGVEIDLACNGIGENGHVHLTIHQWQTSTIQSW